MKKIFILTLAIGIGFGFTFYQTEPKSKTTIDKINEANTSINWITLEQAMKAQAKKPKKIFMDAYTDWCGPCKMLDANTFQNADFVKYVNENYYAVKFDAEGNETINFKGKTYTNPNYDPAKDKARNSSHQLAQALQVRSYPSMIFLDEQGNFLHTAVGYMTAQQLEIYLKLFATNEYKNLKTEEDWKKYQANFKATFK